MNLTLLLRGSSAEGCSSVTSFDFFSSIVSSRIDLFCSFSFYSILVCASFCFSLQDCFLGSPGSLFSILISSFSRCFSEMSDCSGYILNSFLEMVFWLTSTWLSFCSGRSLSASSNLTLRADSSSTSWLQALLAKLLFFSDRRSLLLSSNLLEAKAEPLSWLGLQISQWLMLKALPLGLERSSSVAFQTKEGSLSHRCCSVRLISLEFLAILGRLLGMQVRLGLIWVLSALLMPACSKGAASFLSVAGSILSLRLMRMSLQIWEQLRELPWYTTFFLATWDSSSSSAALLRSYFESSLPIPVLLRPSASYPPKYWFFSSQLKRILFMSSICLQSLYNHSGMSSRGSSSDRSGNRSERNDQNDRRKRYKYCCRKCKHTEEGRKSCVCVVPLSQRRTAIGDKGCQTCGCNGCSIEDYTSRGEDPEYRPRGRDVERNSYDPVEEKFDPKNGCCRKCMKAFSKSGKSCLCQVPKEVRKTKLPLEGCKICSCKGCNPRDDSESASNRSYSRSREKSVSTPREDVDSKEFNLNNTDNSVLGKVIIVEYNLFPGMLGLGIPQRTPNYILGKPL